MAHDSASAKRTHDTGPLPELSSIYGEPDDNQQPDGRPWLKWIFFGSLATVGAVVAVLLLLRLQDPLNDQRPVEVVRRFAAAVEARDASAMLATVEPTVYRRELGPEIRAYMEHIEQIRFEDPQYELLQNNGRRALVRWTATVHYELRDLGGGNHQLDTTLELTNIQGSWYVRSVMLPNVTS